MRIKLICRGSIVTDLKPSESLIVKIEVKNIIKSTNKRNTIPDRICGIDG